MSINTNPKLFRAVLIQGSVLTGLIAVLGALIGGFTSGMPGVAGSLIGAAITLLFTSLTALAVWFGSRQSLAVFYGVVLGGWLVKIALFMVLIAYLRGLAGIDRMAFFLSVVASIIGTLAIDTRLVLRSRIPIIEN